MQKVNSDMTYGNETFLYPRLIRRIQACVIDSIVFSFIFVASFLIVSTFIVEHFWLRAFIVFLPIFILEPAMVSLTGGTIGHHLIKLRVQNANNAHNINIIFACFRFILKSVLGAVSLVFILTTRKHQAIHDFLVNSVVVHKDATIVSKHEALVEREVEEKGYIYPSKLRRIFMIIFYNTLCLIIIVNLSIMFTSDACLESNDWTPADKVISVMTDITIIITFIFVLIAGWKGRLFGCRRIRIESSDIA